MLRGHASRLASRLPFRERFQPINPMRTMRNARAEFSGAGGAGGAGGVGPELDLAKDVLRKYGPGLALAGAGLVLWTKSVLFTDAGVTYIVQNNLNGSLSVLQQPGLHLVVPFFSRVTQYKQVVTVTFENKKQSQSFFEDEVGVMPAARVTFADTYTGLVPTTFRFKLSHDPDSIVRMHKEFRSYENLVRALLVRNALNVTVITATQYTGEEFYQGGLNQFKNQLEDQLRHGAYNTVRKQVEVEQLDLAPVTADQSHSGNLQKTMQLMWKTVPTLDKHGKQERAENPLAQYGIEVTQVTLGDPLPEEQLRLLLMDKKRLVADRIKAVQEQETSKAQAKTEQLRKDIQRTREVQDAQRAKELAVIGQRREVEVAQEIARRELVEEQKKADVAKIEKSKQLAMAEAEREIQKARSEAVQFEAKAILAKGQAEAAVLKAKYDAKRQAKEIYMAELNRDMSQMLYANLKDFKVEMPQNLIQGNGSGKLTSNLDVITGMAAFDLLSKSGVPVK